MTVNRNKKVKKYRGSKTHGCGSMKKRRGAGHRGGKGASGSGKRADQKKPTVWKGKYFGKSGFNAHSRTPTAITLNVGMLDQMISRLEAEKKVAKEGDAYVVDGAKIGYTKLLGEGRVTHKLKVSNVVATPKAAEKITAAGGEVAS